MYWVSILALSLSASWRLLSTRGSDFCCFWKYYNIIEVDEMPVELKITETCLHQCLECSQGIHQSKRDMITFIKSQWAYSKCCQWLGCLIHLDLPLAWCEVQCCKPNSPIQTVWSIFDLGETIGIFDSVGIQFSQISAKSELTILLIYQYNWASPRAMWWPYGTYFQHLFQMLPNLLIHTGWNLLIMFLKCAVICKSNTMFNHGCLA